MQPSPVELNSLDAFREHLARGKSPAVLRGAASSWASVTAAQDSDSRLVRYLRERDTGHPVYAILGKPEIGGSFGFSDDSRAVNYAARQSPLGAVLARFADAEQGDFAIAVQAAPVRTVFRDWDRENRNGWLPSSVDPTMWVSMASCVAPHSDVHDNVAVVVAGARRFTLYPPEEIDKLYLGPLLSSPGGVPTSTVNIRNPDAVRHPMYPEALQRAMRCTLHPGDALFIPALWWHAVESLERINVLVNYWFSERHFADAGSEEPGDPAVSLPDALAHAILAFAALPREKRRRWQTYFDHLVFRSDGSPAAHLPADLDDLLSTPSPAQASALRERIAAALRGDDSSDG